MYQAGGEYVALQRLATKRFHLLSGPRALVQLCLSVVYIILNESRGNVKLCANKSSVENLTSLTIHAVGLFPGLTPPPPLALLLCVKAAEPRRHREDSPDGGRSHAVPPSRGPETGSLIAPL